MSGDGQGFGAGLAFAFQSNNPAVSEQRAEEPVHATVKAQLLQPLQERAREVFKGQDQDLCRNGDGVCLIC